MLYFLKAHIINYLEISLKIIKIVGILIQLKISITKAPVRHKLQPLCDLSATKIQNDRRGCRYFNSIEDIYN